MSEVKEAPKETSGSGSAALQDATTQAELTAIKLATAKAILQAAEKEHDAAMDVLAKAAAEAEKEYAKIATTTPAPATKPLTNKRNEERIFRREMGEPEFFRSKKDLIPKNILSEEDQEEISRKVEEFTVDATPQYMPQHVLSRSEEHTSELQSH